MRTMKAIVTGMSAATLAMVMACGISTTADAATAALDASKQTMAVTGADGCVEVMVSFDAIKVAKTGISWNDKAKWDVYDYGESGAVTVDLSALNVKKDMYIAVKDNTSATPNVYHIAPDATKLAGKYEVAEKKSKLTLTDNKVAVPTTVKLEYKTANASTWTEYRAESFAPAMAMYEQQGATLYFRKKAVAFTLKSTSDDESETPANQAYVMNEFSAGSFATAEVKVKVTKMANAPAATFNYDTGVITTKKGTEYRFIDNAGKFVAPAGEEAKEGDWTPAPESNAVSIDITKSGVFETRTAADKKVASKIAVYAYKGVTTPTTGSVANGWKEGDTVKKLNLIYGQNTKGADQVTFKSTNADASYIIYSADPATTAKPKVVATLLKSGETKYKDVAVLKTKLADETEVYVVTASDKKTGVFRSKALKVTISYPKASEGEEEE